MGLERILYFITHPEVRIDAAVPVPEWSLSERGRERMLRLAADLASQGIASVWSSAERKAIEAAEILAARLRLVPRTYAMLGENDRSATGYLPKERFEATADRFFAEPEQSVEGWERAVDAQRRIVGAIDHVLATSSGQGNVAVVAHGAVGTLLLCALKGVAIARSEDQPSQGHWFAVEFGAARRRLIHGWLAY